MNFKKGLSLFASIVMIISLCSCNNNQYYRENDNTELNNAEETDISNYYYFKSGSNFNNGVAWVRYLDESENWHTALINKTGKIIYSCDEYCYCYNCENGFNFASSKDNSYIVDNNGNEIASSLTRDYNAIIACGNNKALVYKYLGNIDSEKFFFGIIDQNGNLIQDYADVTDYLSDEIKNDLKENPAETLQNSRYEGDNIFSIDFGGVYRKLWFNTDSNAFFWDNLSTSDNAMANTRNHTFNNGCVCGFCWYDNYNSLPGYICVVKKNNFEHTYFGGGSKNKLCGIDIEPFIFGREQFVSQCMYLNSVEEETYLVDCSVMEKYRIDTHNCKSVLKFEFHNTYGVITLTGQDDSCYNIVIDNKGNELISSFKCQDCILSDDVIVCDSEYIIDKKGNILADNLPIDRVLSEFHEDYALAEIDSHHLGYINKQGEITISQIYM